MVPYKKLVYIVAPFNLAFGEWKIKIVGFELTRTNIQPSAHGERLLIGLCWIMGGTWLSWIQKLQMGIIHLMSLKCLLQGKRHRVERQSMFSSLPRSEICKFSWFRSLLIWQRSLVFYCQSMYLIFTVFVNVALNEYPVL